MIKKPTFTYYLNKDSFFFKIGFWIKFCVFIILSLLILLTGSIFIQISCIILFLSLLWYIWFIRKNLSVIKFLLFSSLIFSCFWLLFSKINGDILLIRPRGSYITNWTIYYMLLAILTWCWIVLLGIVFMATTSEDELINFFLKYHFPKKFIFIISIALNTFNFAIKDIETINYALLSRRYNNSWLIKKIKKIFYIWVAILLSNFKKVDILTQIFSLKEDLYNNK